MVRIEDPITTTDKNKYGGVTDYGIRGMSRLSIRNRRGTCCRKAQVLVTRLRAKEAEAGNVGKKLLARLRITPRDGNPMWCSVAALLVEVGAFVRSRSKESRAPPDGGQSRNPPSHSQC